MIVWECGSVGVCDCVSVQKVIENQRMSMRNLCLEVLWLDYNNMYK